MAITKVTSSVVGSGSATDGYVLTADGSGNSAWEAAAGGGVAGIVSTADATAITIDSSENVGIGTSSPTFSAGGGLNVAQGTFATIRARGGSSTGVDFAQASDGKGYLYVRDNADLIFGTNNAESMRIDSSGKTMIGATSPVVSCMLTVRGNFNNERGLGIQSTTNGGDLVMFYATAQVGTITSSGGGVTYGSASDYRLKENVAYTWDATTRLKQLKPARFNFISDETDTLIDGFIAHEVSNIVPAAVSGDKDATETFNNAVISADSQIYEEGVTEAEWIQGKAETPPKYEADTTWASSHTQPKMQMFDPAKLVPLLTKALQEQQTIIEDLQARIETLENV